MGTRSRTRRLLERLLGYLVTIVEAVREDDGAEKPVLEEAPHEYLPNEEGPSERVLCTIVSSRALTNRAGAAPEESIARQFHRALRGAGLPHRIDVYSDISPVPPAEGTVGSGSPAWWRDEAEGILERGGGSVGDANLLLVDQVGGGGTYGRWNVVGAGGCESHVSAAESRRGWPGASLSAALHELGHTFGLNHDLDQGEPGDQHTGEGWNDHEDGTWHRTPMNVDHDVTNICGVEVPRREYDPEVAELEFTTCTVQNWNPFQHRPGK